MERGLWRSLGYYFSQSRTVFQHQITAAEALSSESQALPRTDTMPFLGHLFQGCATVKIFLIKKREEREEAFPALVKSGDRINS